MTENRPKRVPDLLGTSYVARRVGVSEETVQRAADNDEIPCLRDAFGRRLFKASDVDTWKAGRQR